MAKTMSQTNEARIVMLEGELSKVRLDLALSMAKVGEQEERIRQLGEMLDRYVRVLETVSDAVFGEEE